MAKQVQSFWKDYEEYNGDTSECICVTVTLQREERDQGEGERESAESLLRLHYEAKGPKAITSSFPIRIEFDGQVLGRIGSFAESFVYHVPASPGSHLLQLIPTQALADLRTRTFVLNIAEPGVYLVDFHWDRGLRTTVHDWTAQVQRSSPIEPSQSERERELS